MKRSFFYIKIVVAIIFILIAQMGISSNLSQKNILLDSLLQLAQNQQSNDTIKIINWLNYSEFYINHNVVIDSLNECDLGIKRAFQYANEPYKATFFLNELNKKGFYHRNLFQFENAIFWFNMQKDYADSLQNGLEKVEALNELGFVYRRTDNYEMAIDAYQQAVALSDSVGYIAGRALATNGLGNIYLKLQNFNEAMLNFRDCLKMEQSTNNLLGVAINLNNIGRVYMNLNDFEKALEYYMLSIEINREVGSKLGTAICYMDIGDVYSEKKEIDKALSYFLLGLQMNTIIDDRFYMAINSYKVAELYMLKKNLNTALPFILESIRLSIETKNRWNLANTYKLMYLVQKNFERTDEAIKYLEMSTALKDSILNENSQRIIFQMQAMFNRERSENKIEILQNEKQIADLKLRKQNYNYNLIVVGLLLMILAIFVLFFILRIKDKANKQLKLYNEEIEQARKNLSEYADILLLAKQDAEQVSKLKSQFLANMSHEIRTPLNSVIGFSDILSNHITDKQQLAYLDSIRSSGRGLLVLIDDILDLSKIESGKMQIEKNPLDMRNLISEITKVFKLQSEQKQIEFEVFIEKDFPKTIFMSELSMRQILFNLIGNAFKFTHNGIITLNLSAQKIDDVLLNINLSIQDTGIGIAQQDQGHIFEAFYQANTDRTIYKGTGLGLAITKRLVEAMDGAITLNSSPGKGTTFSIMFSSVKAVPQRTSLHLVTSYTYRPSEGTHFALISDDIKIQAAFDSFLLEFEKTCDVYEDAETCLISTKTRPYVALFWDVKQANDFNLKQIDDNPKIGFQEQTSILLFQQKSHLEIVVPDWIKHVFQIPNESKQLAHFVDNLFNENTVKPGISLEVMDSTKKIDKNIQQLTLLFIKAQQSQFINDAENFADALVLYSIRSENSNLLQLGQKLKGNVQSFDIEQIEIRIKEFQSYLNTLQIEL